jgi:hypothetical protein
MYVCSNFIYIERLVVLPPGHDFAIARFHRNKQTLTFFRILLQKQVNLMPPNGSTLLKRVPGSVAM